MVAHPPAKRRATVKRMVCGGISWFERTVPASSPNTKNWIAGSTKFCPGAHRAVGQRTPRVRFAPFAPTCAR